MREVDLDAILVIERECFPDEPWTRGMFQRELQISFSTSLIAHEACAPGAILGYVCWRRLGDEWEILNLAVGPAGRRRGLGRALVAQVIDDAKAAGGMKIHLEVRDDNQAAIFLYRSCEFFPSGLRRHYYGRDHHAVLMTWSAGNSNCAGADVDNQKAPD